jgi:hypothetical protein
MEDIHTKFRENVYISVYSIGTVDEWEARAVGWQGST